MPTKATTTPNNQPSPSKPKRRLSRKRKVLSLLLLLCAIPITAIVLTRTPLLKAVALDSIESALGCEANAKAVRLSANGTLTFVQLELSNPTLNNDAATFFYAERLDVRPEWSSIAGNSVRFQRVQVTDPIITLSINDKNQLNLLGLKPPSGSGNAAYPDVTFTNATIQFAEHTDSTATTLAVFNMQGRLLANPNAPRLHSLTLQQINTAPGEAQASLTGTLDSRTGEVDLRLQDVDIEQWSRDAAPSHVEDLWRRMNVRGRIDSAELTFDPRDSTLSTTIRPQGVTMALPITLPSAIYDNSPCGLTPDQAGEFIELTDVSGTLQFTNVEDAPNTPVGLIADVNGTLQGLQTQVQLQYQGTTTDAPFVADIRVAPAQFRNPCDIISFAPNIAVQIYDRFAGRPGDNFAPTGTLAAEVLLERETRAGDINYQGRVDISDAAARFETVPYLFENINGAVTFNTQRVDILPFTASATSGATLAVEGSIVPPGDGAEVVINIDVKDMPVDQEFIAALPDIRRPLVESIINHDQHQRLIEEGFIQTRKLRTERIAELQHLTQTIDQLQRINPQDPEIAAMLKRAEALQERADVPVFELGGLADLDVQVFRPLGMDTNYATTINADITDLALLPGPFPYPATAPNVSLTIAPEGIRLEQATLLGVSGAQGTLVGTVLSPAPGQPVVPDITIDAGQVPVDALLIQALPGEPYREPTDALFDPIFPPLEEQQILTEATGPIAFSVQRFLSTLNIDGTVNAATKLHPRQDDPTQLGFTTTVTLQSLTANPTGATDPLTNLTGVITVNDTTLNAPHIQATIDDADITASVRAFFPRNTQRNDNTVTQLTVDLSALGIDIRQRFEAFLNAIEPARAVPVAQLRERFDPSGTLDANINFQLSGTDTDYTIVMSNARRIRYDAFGGRIAVTQTADEPSRAVLTPDRVTIEQSQGEFRFIQRIGTEADRALDALPPQGTVAFQGQYPIAPIPASEGPLTLTLDIQDASFESAFVNNVARTVAPGLADWLREVDFEGTAGADITIDADAASPPSITGQLRPTTAALTQRGTRITFNDIQGTIDLDAGGGRVNIQHATADAIDTVSFQGSWLRDVDKGVPFGVEGTLSAHAPLVTDEVLAALPLAAETALRALELNQDAELTVNNAQIQYRTPNPEPAGAPRSGFKGTVHFENADVTAGLRFRYASGTAEIDIQTDEDAISPDITINAAIDTATLDPLTLTEGRVTLRSPRNDLNIYFPDFSASIYSGTAAGTAAVFRTPDPTDLPTFTLDLAFTNIDTERMLTELGINDDDVPDQPYTQGVIDGALAVQGTVGDIDSRRGRLVLRAQQSRFPGNAIIDIPQVRIVVNAVLATSKPPFVIPAIATLLGAPADPIDFAYADATILGPRIAFSDISLETTDVAIRGAGTITLPEQALDLTFSSFELNEIPVLSEWIRGVRDQFIAVEVTGTIADPVINPRFFKGAGELIDSIFLGREPRRIGEDANLNPPAQRRQSTPR